MTPPPKFQVQSRIKSLSSFFGGGGYFSSPQAPSRTTNKICQSSGTGCLNRSAQSRKQLSLPQHQRLPVWQRGGLQHTGHPADRCSVQDRSQHVFIPLKPLRTTCMQSAWASPPRSVVHPNQSLSERPRSSLPFLFPTFPFTPTLKSPTAMVPRATGTGLASWKSLVRAHTLTADP